MGTLISIGSLRPEVAVWAARGLETLAVIGKPSNLASSVSRQLPSMTAPTIPALRAKPDIKPPQIEVDVSPNASITITSPGCAISNTSKQSTMSPAVSFTVMAGPIMTFGAAFGFIS